MSKRGLNIYKRKDGRWEGRIKAEATVQGKSKYKYIYGKSYSEVKKKMLLYKDDQHLTTSTKNNIKYADLLKEWMDSIETQVKESTYARYNFLVNRHIEPYLGNYYMSQLTNAIIEGYIVFLLKEGRLDKTNTKGLSPKTVSDIVVLIKSTISFANNQGYENLIKAEYIKIKKAEHQIRVLSNKEQLSLEKELYSEITNLHFGILLCLYTGIRIGELCALKWKDFDFSHGSITVHQTMQRIKNTDTNFTAKTKVVITSPKSSCSYRTIPLPEHVLHYAELLHTVDEAYVLSGSYDKFVEPRTLQNLFKKVIAKCGIESANYHCLRHTFATRCVEVGFDIKSLSEILGHANVNITLGRYVHSSYQLKEKNMQLLCPLKDL